MTTPTLRGILSPFEEIFPISWGALLGMIMDAGPYRGGGGTSMARSGYSKGKVW